MFSNPVYAKDFPDPTIWRGKDGYFYGICTGFKTLIKSNDLVNWKVSPISPLPDSERSKITAKYKSINAPDVTVVNGKRLAYVGMINDVRDVAVGVLKETDTPGVFSYIGPVTTYPGNDVRDSSDPEVVVGEDGRVWLFFGGTFGVYRLELSADGLSAKEGAVPVRVAGQDSYSGSDRMHVFEGEYLFKHDGYWYLFLSEGSYNTYKYRIVAGRSATLDGEFLAKDGKKLYDGDASVLMSSEKTDYFFGPGHNGEIFTDTQGRTFMFYHCHNQDTSPGASYIPRPLMCQEIFWGKDGWPYFEGGKPQRIGFSPVLK